MVLLSATFAAAQNFRGGINGSVTDQGGAAIPGAQVQITDDATGVIHSSVASSAGEYSFQDLPLGLYTVSATSSGFETLKVEELQVSAGAIYSLPLKLAIASQATTVEVNAADVTLDTTTPTQTTILPSKTVQDIPLNGRDFTQMLGLAPGFAGYSLGGYGSVNGTRANQWGESAGGPFWKDHSFWFENFEKQQLKIATGFQGTEPSAAYQAQALRLLAYYGVPENSATTNLLSVLWPADSLTGPATSPNFLPPAPETGYGYNGVIKLDHNFNQRQSLSARAFLGQGNQIAPVCNCVIPYYFEVGPIHVYNYSIVHNWTVSTHITNQISIGVNYFNQVFSDQKTGFDVGSLGFVTNSPYTQSPNIQISGFEAIGQTAPEGRNDITGHLDEALSWVKGKHEFRFGGEYRQAEIDEFYQRHSVGSFKFTGFTGPWAANYENASGQPLCTGYFASTPELLAGCQSGSLGNVLSLADFLAGDLASGTIARGDAERQVSSPSSASAQANSNSLTHSPIGGDRKGSLLLPHQDMTGDSASVRGLVKVAMTRYKAWLVEVAQPAVFDQGQ